MHTQDAKGDAGAGLEWRVLPATKELHAQQSKDHDEEKEEEKQADDGLHGVHQGHHQVP